MQPFCVFCRKSGHPTSDHSGRKVFSPQEAIVLHPKLGLGTGALDQSKIPNTTKIWKEKNREKVNTYQRELMRKRRAQ